MAGPHMNATEREAARSETPATLVWIDTDDAIIVRWHGSATIERIAADVPPQLDRFVERVAARVPAGDPVRIIGPGEVCSRLGRVLRAEDRRLGRRRAVASRASAPLTERELVADIRALACEPTRRRTRKVPPR